MSIKNNAIFALSAIGIWFYLTSDETKIALKSSEGLLAGAKVKVFAKPKVSDEHPYRLYGVADENGKNYVVSEDVLFTPDEIAEKARSRADVVAIGKAREAEAFNEKVRERVEEIEINRAAAEVMQQR